MPSSLVPLAYRSLSPAYPVCVGYIPVVELTLVD
jgi:hypothetical protein